MLTEYPDTITHDGRIVILNAGLQNHFHTPTPHIRTQILNDEMVVFSPSIDY